MRADAALDLSVQVSSLLPLSSTLAATAPVAGVPHNPIFYVNMEAMVIPNGYEANARLTDRGVGQQKAVLTIHSPASRNPISPRMVRGHEVVKEFIWVIFLRALRVLRGEKLVPRYFRWNARRRWFHAFGQSQRD
jgi:hypothetical protein